MHKIEEPGIQSSKLVIIDSPPLPPAPFFFQGEQLENLVLALSLAVWKNIN